MRRKSHKRDNSAGGMRYPTQAKTRLELRATQSFSRAAFLCTKEPSVTEAVYQIVKDQCP